MRSEMVDVLQAYLNRKVLPLDKANLSSLISSAKEQALLPFLYAVYQEQEFKGYYISACVTQQKFITLQNELTLLFDASRIPHFFIKGSVLYTLYEDTALRTRGDIDIVVPAKQIIEAKEVLIKNHYELILDSESQHHIEFIKNGLMVELHFEMTDSYEKGIRFFSNPFELCKPIQNSLYELAHENHFIFCLNHFSRHLIMGAGLRYILDFYYMLKKWNLDLDEIHSLIHQFAYEKIYCNILNAIYFISGEKLDEFEIYDIDFFLEYLSNSGIHGFGAKNKRAEKGFATKGSKMKVIISGTFMTKKSFRISLYPHLGKHWFTYPLCLIHRVTYLVFTRSKKLFTYIFSNKNKVTKEEIELYKKLGIR